VLYRSPDSWATTKWSSAAASGNVSHDPPRAEELGDEGTAVEGFLERCCPHDLLVTVEHGHERATYRRRVTPVWFSRQKGPQGLCATPTSRGAR
jgi:hypothetical protein